MRVFVLNKRGKPLMPCSPAKARLLPKERNAIVVRRTPFTVQLTIATGETKQPVSLGVDAGYKHVGLSASTEKAELYASEIELRQDITDLLSARRELRRARRNRKTRYRGPRFDNRIRTKRKEWFAPSVENRINAHLSRIEKVLRLLPVTTITVETASFDTQLLKNPDISGERIPGGRTARLLEHPRVCSLQRRACLPALLRQIERPGAQCSSLGKQAYRRRFARQLDYAL